jgi:hypothetical protein
MNRRDFVRIGLASSITAIAGNSLAAASLDNHASALSADLIEATVAQLQAAMVAGKLSARSLAAHYLKRIAAIDKAGPHLNAIIEINPDALALADALDRERQAQGPRGPLHGIPVLIKDNIATHDRMQTTAGSLALVGSVPPQDACCGQEAARGGGRDSGQDQLERVGQHPLVTFHQRLERARRARLTIPMRLTAILAAPVPVRRRPSRPIWRRWRSAARPMARSFRRLPSAAWSGSSRPWAWSAATASFRLRIRRIPPGRLRAR